MTQIEPVEKISEQEPQTIKQLLKAQNTEEAFAKVLGARAPQYIASIITMVNNNELVKTAEPVSLVNACIIAATLDLSIDPNLGWAYIVPYKNKKTGKTEAQFQMGWKGYVQLAERTGEYRRLGVNKVFEGQLVELDEFGEPTFDFNNKTSDKVIGYMAYFELLNGFRKISYMTKDEAEQHGKRYSQSYKKNFGVWKDDFDGMAKKTVLKLLLSKYAPLSTQMQKAIQDDQKANDEYLDNKVTFEVENASIEGELIEEQFDDIKEQEAHQEFQNEDPEYPKGRPLQGNITEPQLIKIQATRTQWKASKPDLAKQLDEYKQLKFGDKSHKELTKQEASDYIEYIEHLKEETNG